MEQRSYKSAIESILFVSGEPVAVDRLAAALDLPLGWTRELLDALKEEYEREVRGIRLLFIRDAVQLVSASENAEYVERVLRSSKTRGLSPATLEVLAIVAYKQPATRAEIDYARGVKSDKPIQILLERELIEEKGRLEKIGRPIIYGTTDEFLRTFGLRSIEELPDLATFEGAERMMSLLESKDSETEPQTESQEIAAESSEQPHAEFQEATAEEAQSELQAEHDETSAQVEDPDIKVMP
jgi:segregation and condensation protein B